MTSYSEAATELFVMAMENIKQGDIHGAINRLSLSLQTEERPGTYFERAKLYCQKDDIERALSDIDRAIELCVSQKKSIDLLNKLNILQSQLRPILQGKRERKKVIRDLVDLKNFDGLLEEFDLIPFRESILEHSKMSARIHVSQDSTDSAKSKLGGNPDLPADFAWPTAGDERPLSFLCQISLTDLDKCKIAKHLPPSGTLSFFYDIERQPWGYDRSHSSGWKVVYFPEGLTLLKTETPDSLEEYCKLNVHKIDFQDELTFEEMDTPLDESMNWAESDSHYDFCREWYGDLPNHRLFGFPQPIQQPDIGFLCHIAANEIDIAGRDYDEVRSQETRATDWKLLLQIDTDTALGIDWGDGGKLYFYITDTDLKALNFTNTWLILQCF